jgi:hypothetical protein
MLKQTVRNHGIETTMIWVALIGAIASTTFIAVNSLLGTVTETGNTVAIAAVVVCAVISWLAYLPGILGLTFGTAEGN